MVLSVIVEGWRIYIYSQRPNHSPLLFIFTAVRALGVTTREPLDMTPPRILIYLLRRDLRVADNPILHHISTSSSPPYTHLLPLYVFPHNQLEVSGFFTDSSTKSPFPEARSQVAGFWRCGPHRAKFLAESLWDLKEGLEEKGSRLVMRVGIVGDIIRGLIEGFREKEEGDVVGVWMTGEEGQEEKREESDVRKVCEDVGIEFKLWRDEKYLIDE